MVDTTAKPSDVPGSRTDAGSPFVFAHANGFPPGCYHALLERLQEHGEVIAPAHRALWPDAPDPLDPELKLDGWRVFATDLIAALELHGRGPYRAVGHSLGAVTIAFAAEQRPDLFERVVLVEPVFLPPEWIAQAVALSLPDRLANPMSAGAARRRQHYDDHASAWASWRSKRVFSDISDDALSALVHHALVPSAEGVSLAFPRLWEARIYAEPPDPWGMLANLSVPTTAVRGSRSSTLNKDSWSRWQALAPNARFIELEGTHLVPLEDPDAVADAALAGD